MKEEREGQQGGGFIKAICLKFCLEPRMWACQPFIAVFGCLNGWHQWQVLLSHTQPRAITRLCAVIKLFLPGDWASQSSADQHFVLSKWGITRSFAQGEFDTLQKTSEKPYNFLILNSAMIKIAWKNKGTTHGLACHENVKTSSNRIGKTHTTTATTHPPPHTHMGYTFHCLSIFLFTLLAYSSALSIPLSNSSSLTSIPRLSGCTWFLWKRLGFVHVP